MTTVPFHRRKETKLVFRYLTAASLVVIALVIGWEAIIRIQHPEPASGPLMIGVALAAIVVNVVIGVWLHGAAKSDINVKGAYVHMLGDAVSALGVVIAGAIVLMTGQPLADPVVSLLIAALILYSSYDILKESTTVLLEGTPVGIDMPDLIGAIGSYGRAHRSDFLIIPQNGDRLLDNQRFVEMIDGFAREDLLYNETEDQVRNPPASILESLRRMRPVVAAAKPILVIEYTTDPRRAASVLRELKELRLIGYVGRRDLKTLSPPAFGCGQPDCSQ